MTATVREILQLLEAMAPADLAEEWDNSGLQVGSGSWPVENVWVALDALPEVVSAASNDGADLLLTHHPLLFRPLRRIDAETPTGRIVQTALSRRMAVVSLHTSLDSAQGGLNDLLAERIGLTDVAALRRADAGGLYKMVIFSSESAAEALLSALAEMPPGRAGRFTGRSFCTRGIGTVTPEGETAAGTVRRKMPESAEAVRIESLVSEDELDDVVGRLRRVHPHEEMAYELFPVVAGPVRAGIGRIGRISPGRSLAELARHIKESVGASSVRMAGDPELQVANVAVCTGSGSSLMKDFFRSHAEVFVSGDLRYHDGRDAETAGRGLIDIGHFGSEHFMVDSMSNRLKKVFSERGIAATVHACRLEKDPYRRI